MRAERAALSEARKIVRQACHILTELGDDALTATELASPSSTVTMHHDIPGQGRRAAATLTRWGTTAASSREPLSAAAGLCAHTKGQAGGLIRLSGRTPKGGGHPINHLVAGAATRAPRTQVRLAAPRPHRPRHPRAWSPAKTGRTHLNR